MAKKFVDTNFCGLTIGKDFSKLFHSLMNLGHFDESRPLLGVCLNTPTLHVQSAVMMSSEFCVEPMVHG